MQTYKEHKNFLPVPEIYAKMRMLVHGFIARALGVYSQWRI